MNQTNDICDFCSREIDCIYCQYCFDEEYIPPKEWEKELYLEEIIKLEEKEKTQ